MKKQLAEEELVLAQSLHKFSSRGSILSLVSFDEGYGCHKLTMFYNYLSIIAIQFLAPNCTDYQYGGTSSCSVRVRIECL